MVIASGYADARSPPLRPAEAMKTVAIEKAHAVIPSACVVLPAGPPGRQPGLTATGSQAWSQNSPGIADVAEASDVFGETLAAGTLSIDGDGTANPAATSPAERSRTARERRP
jgi:hypothetical protein